MSDDVQDLLRRLTNLACVATVVEVDADNARLKVDFLNNHSAWLPWTVGRAGGVRQWSAPQVGENLLLICPQGEIEQGILLPSLYKDEFPAPSSDPHEHLSIYEDGAVIAYNDETHQLIATLPEGGTTELVSDGGITLTGDVTINGNTTVNGATHSTGNVSTDASVSAAADVSDAGGSLQGNRDVFNSHTHGSGPPPNEQQ